MTPTVRALTALLIFAGWLGIGIVIRVRLRRHRAHDRAGDHVIDGGSADPPSKSGGRPRQWWALIQMSWAVLGLAAPLAALAGLPPLLEVAPAWLIGGLVLAVAGCAGSLAAQHAMGSSWRVGVDHRERTSLVADGPFRLARNPIFTMMFTAAAGLTLLLANVIALAALVLLIAAVQAQVRRVEEPYLLATHGRLRLTRAARDLAGRRGLQPRHARALPDLHPALVEDRRSARRSQP